MNDPNDFFDDTIDDEFEPDELEFMNLDEEDEPHIKMRTVLLAKNGLLAVLGLKTSAESGMIVRSDPRQGIPSAQTYDDPAAAAMWFNRSLATSKKNGWSVIYDGVPLAG